MIKKIIANLLYPNFVKKIDNHLIIHFPILWYAGIIRFIYLILLLNIVLMLMLFATNTNVLLFLFRDSLLYIIIWGTIASKQEDIYFKILRKRDILLMFSINFTIVLFGLTFTILIPDYLFYNNLHNHLLFDIIPMYIIGSLFVSTLSLLFVQKYYNSINFPDWLIILFYIIQCFVFLIPMLYAAEATEIIPFESWTKYFIENKTEFSSIWNCTMILLILFCLFIFIYCVENNFWKSIITIFIIILPMSFIGDIIAPYYFFSAILLIIYYLVLHRIIKLNSVPMEK